MKYCYIRVSTDKQEYERQVKILQDNGYINDMNCKYIEETFTGKTTKRPVYDELVNKLEKNDTLIVESLTRLSRAGIVKTLEEVSHLVQDKKINVTIIKENFNLKAGEKPDANTNMLLGIFSVLGQFERDLISERTKEALQAKKINGTKSGRPIGRPLKKESNDENLLKTLKLLNDGESYRNACYITRFPKATLQIRIKQLKEKYDTNDLQTIINKLEKGE